MGNATIDNIDRNLESIRTQLNILANQLSSITQATEEGTTRSKPLTEEEIRVGGIYTEAELKSAGFTREPSLSKQLMESTYSVRMAATALRGYMMLLDQAGLSRNQKEAVRELEYIMMAAMKAAQTIKLLILAYQTMAAAEAVTPMGLFYLALAGGVGAASIAYSNKTLGGGV